MSGVRRTRTVLVRWFDPQGREDELIAEERVVLATAELLAEAMERRGLTQAQVAKALGVSASEVSQRLSGRRNLSLRSLARMLHVLGFGVETTLQGIERLKPPRASG